MAKIKYSALVSGMRNKLNGSVGSKNRYGSYWRNKTSPVNPQSIHQLKARGTFGLFSEHWRTLTQTQRDSWLNAGSDFPVTDQFGDKLNLQGNDLFIRLNVNLMNAGADPILTAPQPQGAGYTEINDHDFDVNGPVLKITPDEGTDQDSEVLIYATPCIGAGRNYVKNDYRLLGHYALTANTALDLKDDWSERFGNLIEGMKLFIKIVYVNTDTGEVGLPSVVSDIIVDSST